MRNVYRWLVAACDPHECDAPQFGILSEKDLSALLSLAEKHSVLGATLQSLSAWKAVQQSSGDGSPMSTLIEQYRLNHFQMVGFMLGLQQVASQSLKALNAACIPCCILKGEDFARRLYPSFSLRPFRDVDLIVPKRNYAEADRVLQAMGYVADLPIRKYDAMDYGQISYRSAGDQRWSVELHWNVINSPSQRTNCSLCWDNLDFLDTAGANGQQLLTPTSLFLLATVHACVGHRFDSLQQLCDIRQLCRGLAGPIDVERLVTMCEQSGCATAVQWSMELLTRVFDCPDARNLMERCQLGRLAAKRFGVLGKQTVLCPETWSSRLRRSVARRRLVSAA